MAKYFQIPFAMNGDRKEIPTEKQEDGSISFDEGYGADYEKNKQVDPTAKDISRQEFNSVLHDITGAIGEIQRSGVATWTNEISYNKGATIIHNGAVYTSTINANKNEPPHTSWSSLDLSSYRKLDDLLFNGMMQVQATGDVGTGVGVLLQESDGTVRGQVVATDQGLQLAQYPENGGVQTFTFPSESGEIATTKYVDDKIGDVDTTNLVSKDDITNELGDSTELVASQALVSQQIADRGLGYGQQWVDVSKERVVGSTYINTTGKPIQLCITMKAHSAAGSIYFEIDGERLIDYGFQNQQWVNSLSIIIPDGSSYSYKSGSIANWVELR